MRWFNGRMGMVAGLVALAFSVIGASLAAPSYGAPRLVATNGTVWVTNRVLNNVTAFDAATGRVIGTIPVGNNPIDVVAPRGTGKVYVSNEADNTISVINTRTLAVTTINTGAKPHHLSVSPNNRFVYFGESGANKIGIIDTRTDTLAEYEAGPTEARTQAVFATPNGKMLLATNTGVNAVVALDARTGEQLWTVPLESNPSEALPDKTGTRAYVSIRGTDQLVVIELESGTVVGRVAVGTAPDTLHLTPDGKTLVIGLRDKPAQIAVVDTATLNVQTIALDGSTTGHNWGSTSGRYSFVVVEADAEKGYAAGVAVVDQRTNSVVTTYPYPGGGRPHGLFFEPGALERGPGSAPFQRSVTRF